LAEYFFQTPYRLQGQQFPEFNRVLECAKAVHMESNSSLQLGSLRQAISLAFLQKYIVLDHLKYPIVIIGDGFGYMSSLLLSYLSGSKVKVVVINLTKNLLIDAVYIRKSIPFANICLVKSLEAYQEALEDSKVNVICIQADNAQLIRKEGIGLAINIASMQEMNPSSIFEYFDILRNSPNGETYFYCANRVEKILPDGTISNFFKYPWHLNDQIIVDELCPWHQYYYNYRRPPFYFPYDGAHHHRLVLIHNTPNGLK
jgi:hypothetical protein